LGYTSSRKLQAAQAVVSVARLLLLIRQSRLFISYYRAHLWLTGIIVQGPLIEGHLTFVVKCHYYEREKISKACIGQLTK